MRKTPLQICHACDKRQRPCHGACACTVDGRDIIDHAGRHDCPLHRYRRRGLGDWLAGAIHRLSRGKVRQCGGCKARAARLNALLPFEGDGSTGD
jgi:hypothetical protein